MALRDGFPPEGLEYVGGESDGWEYRTVFSGMNLKYSYDMIKAFLEEEGYEDVPIPKDATELEYFRLPTRNRQILLFEDNGYIHFPIKILFPVDGRNKRKLTLCVIMKIWKMRFCVFTVKGSTRRMCLGRSSE